MQYIRHGRFICNGCRAQFPTVEAWDAHATAAEKAGDYSHGGYTDDSYTEKVDNGHYEQVQTGTQRVQTGTRKVLDHYACSTCGATK